MSHSYDRRTASAPPTGNPFTENPGLKDQGWDAAVSVMNEYKALKQLADATANLREVHAKNAPVWKALREGLEKADPGLQHIRELLLSSTSTALYYGIDIKDIQLKELEPRLADAITECDRIHKNLSEVLR